jgi:hypothetical protein
MEKQNDSIREGLLARLPQPENLAAYREEMASLLAKHEKALFWEKMPSKVLYGICSAIVIAYIFWGRNLGPTAVTIHFLLPWAVLFCVGAVQDLRYRIYRSRVDTLKEVKQVQLQLLEIQASLQKQSCE